MNRPKGAAWSQRAEVMAREALRVLQFENTHPAWPCIQVEAVKIFRTLEAEEANVQPKRVETGSAAAAPEAKVETVGAGAALKAVPVAEFDPSPTPHEVAQALDRLGRVIAAGLVLQHGVSVEREMPAKAMNILKEALG